MKIKKSLVLGMTALLLASFMFVACEGVEGPKGPAGTAGGSGTDGYAPAASIAAVKALFDAGVNKAYLTGTDTGSSVTEIQSGKTLLVPVTAELGSGGGGLLVKSGGTLLISGAATLNTGGVTVESGGTLTVLSGGNLITASTKALTVKGTAVIKSGGILTAGTTLGADDDTDSDTIIAKYIGGITKSDTAAASDAAGGRITFESGAWLNVIAADAVEAKGFAAHKRLSTGAVTNTSAFPATGTGYVLKVTATSANLDLTSVPPGDELIIGGVAATLAANLEVAGTVTVEPSGSLVSSTYDLTIKGMVVAGDAVITASSTSPVEATTAAVTIGNATGRGSVTFAATSILTVGTNSSVVVGGPNGIKLGEGAYGATGTGQTSVILGLADGGATLTIGSTASVFLVGVDIADSGYLTVGAKSKVNLGHTDSALITGNTTDNSAVVEFAIGSTVGVAGTYGKGITIATGKGNTANGSTILPAAADITSDAFNKIFKLKSNGSADEWVAF